ncbi:hypothetical protein GCM10018952_69040 [Streptosporangium vulgare]
MSDASATQLDSKNSIWRDVPTQPPLLYGTKDLEYITWPHADQVWALSPTSQLMGGAPPPPPAPYDAQ